MKVFSSCMLLACLFVGVVHAEGGDMTFHGMLVNLPCTIPDADRVIKVHMGSTNAHDLYLHQPMPRVPFILHLEDCNPTVAATVSVTISGLEDTTGGLPGYLAIDSEQSGALGIAIGLENGEDAPVKVNETTPSRDLLEGENRLAFQVYIAGEPNAIKNRNINTGSFAATARLDIDYE